MFLMNADLGMSILSVPLSLWSVRICPAPVPRETELNPSTTNPQVSWQPPVAWHQERDWMSPCLSLRNEEEGM